MNLHIARAEELGPILRCPNCRSDLIHDRSWRCLGSACGRTFPVHSGVPILLNEENSLFRFTDYEGDGATYFGKDDDPTSWKFRIAKALYDVPTRDQSRDLLEKVGRALAENPDRRPRILVIGSGLDIGSLRTIHELTNPVLVLTDVAVHEHSTLVCDAHDLPFDDGSFDAVLAQAVLEHVVDPKRSVSEIHRVLRKGGVVLSDTPFIQQVHGGRYDFTRFTPRGHRLLFRQFSEIDSGISNGPAVALAWSWRYFLLSLTDSLNGARVARIVAKLTSFWLPWLDRLESGNSTASDAASSVFFIGRKGGQNLSDRELIEQFQIGLRQ